MFALKSTQYTFSTTSLLVQKVTCIEQSGQGLQQFVQSPFLSVSPCKETQEQEYSAPCNLSGQTLNLDVLGLLAESLEEEESILRFLKTEDIREPQRMRIGGKAMPSARQTTKQQS